MDEEYIVMSYELYLEEKAAVRFETKEASGYHIPLMSLPSMCHSVTYVNDINTCQMYLSNIPMLLSITSVRLG